MQAEAGATGDIDRRDENLPVQCAWDRNEMTIQLQMKILNFTNKDSLSEKHL